jgi:hypothetical protein
MLEEVEIHRSAFRRVGDFSRCESGDGRQGVVSLMLQGGGVGVAKIVEKRVVLNGVADRREIDSLISRRFEDCEVRAGRFLYAK